MDRTDKAKIALVVLLISLAAWLILSFFPTPLEFSPYTGNGGEGELQMVTATEIRLAFSLATDSDVIWYFYQIRTPDSAEEWNGLLTSYQKFYDEVYENEVTFTGRTVPLIAESELLPERQQEFYQNLQVSEPLLEEYDDKVSAYQALCHMTALDLTMTDRTEPNPASFWVALAAAVAFCCMTGFLLREYTAGGFTKR